MTPEIDKVYARKRHSKAEVVRVTARAGSGTLPGWDIISVRNLAAVKGEEVADAE
jgi:hypothetical protein